MDAFEPMTWREFTGAWEIYRTAVLTSAIAGAALAYLSVFVVLRRMVFLSAAVTQAAGFGVALAFYVGIHHGIDVAPQYMAVAVSLAVAGLLVVDPTRLGLSRELVLAFTFLVASGGAVLLGSRISQEAHEISAILFGDAVLVSDEDYRLVRNTSAAVLALHIWWYRGFTFASFDPIAARVQRLPVRLLDAALVLSIGVLVGVTARALGALPVFAFATLPGAAALLVAGGRLWLTFALAVSFGAAAGVGGYLLATFRNFSVGGSQTIVAAGLLAVALALRGALYLHHRIRS